MSEQYSDEMTGVLFPNDKQGNPNRPDFTGSATIQGSELWVSAWKKVSKGGKHYLSFSYKLKDDQAPQPAKQTGPAPVDYNQGKDDIDDCPF